MNTQKVVGKVGKFNLCFRPERLTSHAGTVLLHDFAQRLGVEGILEEELHVKTRARGSGESAAISGLVYNVSLGGEHWSDLEVVRGDPGTQELLDAEGIRAPTTAGELLGKFAIGEVRDLPRVPRRRQERGRPHQRATPCTSDRDSSRYEQVATPKAGSTKADKGASGYHPLRALWAEEGEVLLSPLRRGSAPTARNGRGFLRPTLQRVPQTAVKKRRAARGFYSKGGVEWGEAAGFPFTSTAEQPEPWLEAITAVPERRWPPVPEYELAAVTELRSQPTGGSPPYRYVINREVAETQAGELDWQYPAPVTNAEALGARAVGVWHLQQAARENAIKAPKSGFGLEKLPTQKFHAHWAYLLIGQLAFDLVAWCKRWVLPASSHRPPLKTIRHHLRNLPGQIVHTARRGFLMISDQDRYQAVWQFAIDRLAHLQFG